MIKQAKGQRRPEADGPPVSGRALQADGTPGADGAAYPDRSAYPDRAVYPDSPVDPDKQVFRALVAEFSANPMLHYLRLNLHVEAGVVTISGRVNSPAERRAVERAARRVAGIKSLQLEIRAAAFPVTVNSA
jgi:hypothetical protein